MARSGLLTLACSPKLNVTSCKLTNVFRRVANSVLLSCSTIALDDAVGVMYGKLYFVLLRLAVGPVFLFKKFVVSATAGACVNLISFDAFPGVFVVVFEVGISLCKFVKRFELINVCNFALVDCCAACALCINRVINRFYFANELVDV